MSAAANQVKPQAVREGTTIWTIRQVFEELAQKSAITSKDLPGIAEATGFHPTTVRLQFYRWRAQSKTAAAKRCAKH